MAWIIVGVVVLILVVIVFIYNGLVRAKVRTRRGLERHHGPAKASL